MAKKKIKSVPAELIVTSAQTANFFDISQSALRNWKGKGCPALGHNMWDLKEVNQWFLDNILETRIDSTDADLAASKRLYWASKARREQLKADQEGDILINRENISPFVHKIFYTFRNGLLNLKNRLPSRLVGKTHTEMFSPIKDECNIILEGISGIMRTGHDFSLLPHEIQKLHKQFADAMFTLEK